MTQDPNTLMWLAASFAFAIGLAAGALLCYLLLPGRSKRSHHQLTHLRQEFEHYQEQVRAHLNTNAELTRQCNDAYQTLQKHQEKAVDTFGLHHAAVIEQDRNVPVHALEEAEPVIPSENEAPKDYAPIEAKPNSATPPSV